MSVRVPPGKFNIDVLFLLPYSGAGHQGIRCPRGSILLAWLKNRVLRHCSSFLKGVLVVSALSKAALESKYAISGSKFPGEIQSGTRVVRVTVKNAVDGATEASSALAFMSLGRSLAMEKIEAHGMAHLRWHIEKKHKFLKL